MRYLLAIVVTVLLPAFGVGAAAIPSSTGAYEVEVIVFENRLPDLEAGELWTWTQTSKRRANGSEPITPPAITPGASELAAAVAALQNDNRYRVLTHQRWVQPAEAKTMTKPILVRDAGGELEGTVLFYMNRFLHVELNLGFQPPDAGPNPIAGSAPSLYRINEQRRVKGQEVHYFDHPKFGVLVRLAPAGPGAIAATP